MSDLWVKSLSWSKDFYRKSINIIETNYQINSTSNPWNCNVHAYGHGINDDAVEFEDIDYHYLADKYTEVMNEFFAEKNILSPFYIPSIWYNYYMKDQYQESHVHEGHYVGVHFLKYDSQEHEGLLFEDDGLDVPNIKEGDIVIFPSNQSHYVKKSKSSKPRITLAFQVNLGVSDV